MADATNRLFIDVIYRNAEKGIDSIKKNAETLTKTMKSPVSTFADDAVKSSKNILGLGKSINQLNDAGLLTTKIFGQAKQQFAQYGKQMGINRRSAQGLSDDFNKLIKNTKSFSFSFLSLIFSGIAMEKIFGGALRSIIDNYKKLAGVNSQFNKGVLKMSASFSYLKFSIANALNNPLVIKAIEFITDSFEYLGDLFADNEGLALGLIGVLATGFGIGKILTFAGTLQQLGLGFGALGGVVTGIETLMGASFLAMTLAGAVAAVLIFLAWKENFGKIRDNTESLVDDNIALFTDLKNNLLSIFGSLFDLFSALYEGDYEKFLAATGVMIDGVLKLFGQFGLGLITVFVGSIKTAVDLSIAQIRVWIKFIVNSLKAAVNAINDFTSSIGLGEFLTTSNLDQVLNIFDSIADPISNALGYVRDAFASARDAGDDFSFFTDLLSDGTEPLQTLVTENDKAALSTENMSVQTDNLVESLTNSFESILEETQLMKNKAEATNEAAAAQERLNEAVANIRSSSGRVSQSFSSVSGGA